MNKIKKFIVLVCLFLMVGCSSKPLGSLTEISMETYHEKVNNGESLIVVFSQTGCSFCRAYKENLKEFIKDHALHVVYVEVDKEENTDMFDELIATELTKLEYLPATIYVKDKEIVDFCEGELMAEQIEIWLYRNGIELD